MACRLLADVVAGAHLVFVGFVVVGAVSALRWSRVLWLHLPCALWGVLIACTDVVCPLTPLEKALRARAGIMAYEGGFLRHYLVTDGAEVPLFVLVLLLNAAIYWRVARLPRRLRSGPAPGAAARPRTG